MKNLFIGLSVLVLSTSLFATETKLFKNNNGDTLELIFDNGTPIEGSFINWGQAGNNIKNRKVSFATYKDSINTIKIQYDDEVWAIFYYDKSNKKCLGFSGLFLTGPNNMCEFKSL